MRSNDHTPTSDATSERPADPRPAWERIAYAWLAGEVDAGQPVTAEQLAAETSVTPQFARDLLRVLRAHRQRDPGLAELRGRLVRDRLTDAYLRREFAGGQRLDPADLAAELGTTATVARQWLHTLRTQHTSDQGLGALAEPASRGEPSTAQLAGLQAHFAQGGHQHAAVTGRPTSAEQVAAEVERAYLDRRGARGRAAVRAAAGPRAWRRTARDRPAAPRAARRPDDRPRAHRAALARPPAGSGQPAV
jgi:hypothetical protein